jgi:hypothetical protein
MDNYEHEIACPNNKGILNYLWYDYFHDSKINEIFFDHQKGLVFLTLACCCDIDEIWNRLKGDDDTRRAYINENINNFTYVLTFKGTKYFHSERLIMINDYINGRFKDTALLKKLTAENKKPLYHFRIQIDDGFMDIIFTDFIIKKKNGRVKYPVKEVAVRTCKQLDEDTQKVALDGDDFERFLAMQKLYQEKNPALLEIARKNLRFDEDGDACLYSAYLLGKLGDASDFPELLKLYINVEENLVSRTGCRCNAVLPKQNILDAIELIHQKIQLSCK